MKIEKIALIAMFAFVALAFASFAIQSDDSEANEVAEEVGVCGPDLIYRFDISTGKLTISGTGQMDDYKYYNSVSGNDPPWASYKNDIKTVNVENGVTKIGNNSFYKCKNLSTVTIGNDVTAIGSFSFFECTSIKSLDLGGSVERVNSQAFSGCSSLEFISFGEKLTELVYQSFENCVSLASINLPKSLTNVESAFRGCTSITHIDVDESNTAYASVSGVLYSKDLSTLYLYPPAKSDANIVVADECTTIGGSAFNDVTNLKTLTIGKNVTYISNGAFNRCSGIETIIVDSGNTSFVVEDGIVYNPDKTVLYLYSYSKTAKIYNVPEGVLRIESNAFLRNPYLEVINIPASCTSISDNSFYNCRNLVAINVAEDNSKYYSVDGIVYANDHYAKICCYPAGKTGEYTIPDGITTFRGGTFNGTVGITTLNLGNDFKSFSESALFDSNTVIQKIVFPESLTAITSYDLGGMKFYDEDGITELDINADNLKGKSFELKDGSYIVSNGSDSGDDGKSESSDYNTLIWIAAAIIVIAAILVLVMFIRKKQNAEIKN